MNNTCNLTDKYIGEILQQLEQDRTKFFTEIKNSSSTDNIKDKKLKQIQTIQKDLLAYKQLLIKEKEKS